MHYNIMPLAACDASAERKPVAVGTCSLSLGGFITMAAGCGAQIMASPALRGITYSLGDAGAALMLLLRVPNIEKFKGDTKLKGLEGISQQLGDASRKVRQCGKCGSASRAKKGLLRCPCHTVYYCDSACQVTDPTTPSGLLESAISMHPRAPSS